MTTRPTVSGVLAAPVSRPARSFSDALERAHAFMALDDASILPEAHTQLLVADGPAEDAVVLLHGFTNNPHQYAQFGPLVRARGANVFVPRLPEHGDRDRMTTRLKSLTAERLLASATEAVDIACGLGTRVSVLGLSTSGLLAAYLGQHREDVWRAVPVSPVYALMNLSYAASSALAWTGRALPSIFLWWDPRIREAIEPPTAYPRFPTRALLQALRIGDDVRAASRRSAPAARYVTTLVNPGDPAVNNRVAEEISRNWSRHRSDGVAYVELHGLPANHDIVDPNNPLARIGVAYPQFLAALFP